MTAVLRPLDLTETLADEFAAAHAALGRAQAAQRRKDTPKHRAAVQKARDRIDAVLDARLDLVREA